MDIIENSKVKEKVYIEKLENGLTIMIIPKQNTNKKYAIIGTHFGSIDNNFVVPGEEKETKIPDGVAHFLEHKMFEQENGTNSLDTISNLGVDANAYTSNDYTAYLIEGTNNFEQAFEELMDYIQHPYFTDENVKKEQGIIEQEINMYEDDPETRVYMEALKCMYWNHPVKIDIAGSVESINNINKEILYNCYNTFYNPSNMALVLCGDFNVEETLKSINQKLVKKEIQGEIKRIYPQEKEEINTKEVENNMNLSKPIFVIGIKDKIREKITAKKVLAVEIILDIILGKSSKLYKKLYETQELISAPSLDYEFSNNYAHILISGQANNPKKIFKEIENTINNLKQTGINEEEFTRIKKKTYGEYVKEYNDVDVIARNFLADYFQKIKPFEYIEEYVGVTLEYTNQVLKETFNTNKMVISVVK